MKIDEFLEQCAGKWFSLRTNYHLDKTQVENSKSDLTVENLSHDRPEIVTLCQQYQINPSDTLGGMKTLWDNSVDWGKPKQIGSTTMVLIPTSDNPLVGKIIHAAGLGGYVLGNDEALTLAIEQENFSLEERMWFASPNLRLRTSLIKNSHGFSQMTFYSEIRKIAPKT
jgi:hypothetical protein